MLPPFLRSFLAHARWRVAGSAALLVAVALLEAAGLLLALDYLLTDLSDEGIPSLASINRSESSASASARWKA